jgi:hypothetical protein
MLPNGSVVTCPYPHVCQEEIGLWSGSRHSGLPIVRAVKRATNAVVSAQHESRAHSVGVASHRIAESHQHRSPRAV